MRTNSSRKIKSRQFLGGFLRNIDKFCTVDYFLAAVVALAATGWIANFGVVPLFLFSAFLLAPMFFFLLALLFSVTHVLETICKLPSTRYKSNNSLFNILIKPYFLPIKSSCVKGIFFSICLVFLHHPAKAGEITQDLILSRGQSTEISVPELAKFNVGNKQVLNYRFDEKNKKLLIRGESLGHSEILVWNKDKTLETYQIFVISKVQEAKLLHLVENLNGLGLFAKMVFPHVKASGTIRSITHFNSYRKLLEKNPEILLDEVELSIELKQTIFAQIYSAFFQDFKDSIKCSSYFSSIICFYPENEAPGESMKKYLIHKFKATFIEQSNQQYKKNYRVKIKLIQLEQLDGEELRLGLEQISGSLADFFSIPLEKIIQKNSVLLAQKKVKLSTLAEPVALLRPLTPAEMQIGADIPFKNVNSNNVQSTDWKFAGLKIKVVLENMGDKLKINYETELTQPATDTAGATSIGGNKEKSSVIIPLKKAVSIFQLSLKTEGKVTDQMPFLNAFPVLGELFKSRSSHSNYKTITGIIEVEENDE